MTTAELTGAELSTRQAAELLGVDQSTIRQWCTRGYRDPATGGLVVLKRVRVGRASRYRREALDEFLSALNRG